MSEDNSGSARKKRGLQSPIRLGEAVALLGVIIAGLGLYVSYVQWVDRQKDMQDEARQEQQRVQAQSALVLRGVGSGAHIRLEPANPAQVVQSQVVYFPAEVRSDPVSITGDGRIEANWFAEGLKRALKGAADGRGERDLPVGVATTFVEDGEVRTDQSLYQLGFTIHTRVLQPAVVDIDGVALSRRHLGGDLQATANAAWAKLAPAPKS